MKKRSKLLYKNEISEGLGKLFKYIEEAKDRFDDLIKLIPTNPNLGFDPIPTEVDLRCMKLLQEVHRAQSTITCIHSHINESLACLGKALDKYMGSKKISFVRATVNLNVSFRDTTILSGIAAYVIDNKSYKKSIHTIQEMRQNLSANARLIADQIINQTKGDNESVNVMSQYYIDWIRYSRKANEERRLSEISAATKVLERSRRQSTKRSKGSNGNKRKKTS